MSATPAHTTDAQLCGLRFDKSEAKLLRDLADRVRTQDLQSDVSTFEEAASAAETGEPLQVHFNEIEEVVAMVAGYVRLGIKQPSIEELSN